MMKLIRRVADELVYVMLEWQNAYVFDCGLIAFASEESAATSNIVKVRKRYGG
jgi:hypothetical protein